jgi:predicted dehydrogenase/threonine dehydrogenase-like Zn-dependent dehydrogenase
LKQVLADLRTGEVQVHDVPVPAQRRGFVLVRNRHSLISAGTEGATLKLGRMSAVDKARARPEQAVKLIELARTQGPLTAYQVAQRALDTPIALGYSSSGVVESVAEDCEGLRPGQFVACAGQGWASHAEFVSVPRRLCVPVPPGVPSEHAAYATVGAIALHSLRVSEALLGESIVVIGLGLVGLLVCQLARANGCHVIGLDVDSERVRLVKAQRWGEAALANDAAMGIVLGLTGGHGADVVIVTAATEEAGPVALAGELCRRKGRVVVVGRTPMVAPRETYLFKELSLLTSMAFGPGTGDPQYEVRGHDYPRPYVRFTEERNLEAFLGQLALGNLDLEPLITHRFPATQAAEAFAALDAGATPRGIGVLIEYEQAGASAANRRIELTPPSVQRRSTATSRSSAIRLSVIGAGNFATNELLPLLSGMNVELRGIVSQTGIRAKALGEKLGFRYCASEPGAVLDDGETDAVLILTRHDTHAPFAARLLAAGKHVFVEKPLALTFDDLTRVRDAHSASGKLVMVGFNRRYASLALRMKAAFADRAQPMVVRYLANVGRRPPEHWLHQQAEGGGVILGEGCHHLDFCRWLIDKPLVGADVVPLRDGNGAVPVDTVQVTLRFADGSIASLLYASNGNKRFPTETVEALCAGQQARLIDFGTLETPGRWMLKRSRQNLAVDKGHRSQLSHFVDACAGTAPAFDVESYFESSRLAIEVSTAANAKTVD